MEVVHEHGEEELDERERRRVFVRASPPAPTFANMNNCENCRLDVGGLLNSTRHHCRNCGGTFCEFCSAQSIQIPYQEYYQKGELRVCDSCYSRIKDFHSQTKNKHVTWCGLLPKSDADFQAEFNLSSGQTPVVIYSCCFFPDHLPFYGHMYLTITCMYFLGYKGKKLQFPFTDISSIVKPDLYFLNALQVYVNSGAEKYFFAGFNGQRDDSYRRFDQLLSRSQMNEKLDVATGKETTLAAQTKVMQQSLLRRASARLPVQTVESSEPESISELDLPAPDAAVAQMITILDIDLQVDVKTAFEMFWSDVAGIEFYEGVMMAMKDIDISVSQWKGITEADDTDINRGFVVSTEHFQFYRKVDAKHPPKITFPGLPRYAVCHRIQRYRMEDGNKRLIISDLQRMEQIPYSDCFEIENRWVFSLDGVNLTHVEVGLQVNFLKSTWFRGQISSSTTSECRDAMTLWSQHATEHISTRALSKGDEPPLRMATTTCVPKEEPTPAAPQTIALDKTTQLLLQLRILSLVILMVLMYDIYQHKTTCLKYD